MPDTPIHIIHTEFITQLRLSGISQAAFARLCGVTTIAVNHWCKGRRPIPRWAWILACVSDNIDVRAMEHPPAFSWHDVLGVDKGCRLSEASAARARLARHYHPDVGGSTDAMQRINAAYDVAKAVARP